MDTFIADFRNKSAYYAGDYFAAVKDGTVTPTPVFSIQGFTDPLFPAVETLQMYRKLKAIDPDYPVYIAFGDVGHSNAQNPHAQWHFLNNQANQFLGQNLLGQGNGTPTTTVTALVTHCPATDTVEHFSGTSWDKIRHSSQIRSGGRPVRFSAQAVQPARASSTASAQSSNRRGDQSRERA